MIQEQIEAVPQNLEAEEQLIGILMNSNAALTKVPWLEPDDFFNPVLKRLFESITAMVEKGMAANALTMKDAFEPGMMIHDQPPIAYLARLQGEIATTDPVGFAKTLRYARSRRAMVSTGEDMAKAARLSPPEVTPTEILGEFEDRLAEVRLLAPRQDTRTAIGSYADAFLSSLSPSHSSGRGVPLVFPELEQVIQEPLEGGNLYGLLSSSGEGKTSLMLQIAEHAARKGSPVLIMSYDQNGEQVFRQIVSQCVGTEVTRIRRGDFSEKEAERMISETNRIKALPIEIIRCKREKIGRIAAYARAFVKRWQTVTEGTPLIILDHSRKVQPDRPNDHEGRIAGAINGECKAVAEETGAAWLNINQRNSGGMSRPNPRPIAKDLFGGEQAKEDFDAIFYLYRKEKWRDEQLKIARDAKEKEQIMQRFGDCEGKAEIGAIKVRYGSDNQRRELIWEGRYTRYRSEQQGDQVEGLF